MAVKLNSTGGGSVTLDSPSTASNYTVTLPSAAGTLATTTGSLASPTITGTVAGGATYTSPTLTGASITAANSNTVEATSGPTSTQLAGMRNKIINGAMMIDQRNAGASVSNDITGSQYCLDRWNIYGSVSSKFTAQQNGGSVTPPSGFTNYLGITSSSAYTVGASETFIVQQSIEGFNSADLGWGTANAKPVTLSFLVYSSLTGTFGGSISNGAFNYSYPFSYSIPIANTWTLVSVTIAGPTSGTWIGATNGLGIRVEWSLGSGSSVSGAAGAWTASGLRSATGATSVVGTNGATFYITGVQLEKGATATPFENRLYGTELALCQRYYALVNNMPGFNQSGSTTTTQGTIQFPVTMRTTPSVGLTAPAVISDTAADYTQSSASIGIVIGTRANASAANVQLGNFTGLTALRPIYFIATSANITVSAEL